MEHNKNNTLLNQEYHFYSKNLILHNIGIQGQIKLKQSKILVVGGGGLGSPSLLYLNSIGIGYLGIIDNDYINTSNLNRQILYKYQDTKKLKTICIKENLRGRNPFCKIITHTYKLTAYNAIDICKYYDIIIDCTDNFNTRYLIERTCYQLHKIHIYGGINQFEGQISVFNYKSNIQYSDLYPRQLRLQDKKCNLDGVLGVVTGTIGILQSTEAIKMILGIGHIMSSKLIVYNLLESSFKILRLYHNKLYQFTNLQANSITPKNQNISSLQFKYIKEQNKQNFIVIDIREKIEFLRGHIQKSINLPLSRIEKKSTINFITSYNIQYTLIIYCTSKHRTSVASSILIKNNLNHYILNTT